MEDREDLKSILPFLPLLIRSSSLYWPPHVVEALKALSEGPSHSQVDTGEVLWLAISDMRRSLSLSSRFLAPSASHGYALLFDELMPKKQSTKWFDEIIPELAKLLLRFPSLLELHYQNADNLFGGIKSGLRLLSSQQAGIVFLSQELIGSLLACAFFCLFPDANRGAENLPFINFDHLFANLYESYSEKQESKISCIIHYFERVCFCMPTGFISFERKVIPAEYCNSSAVSPEADFWSKSIFPLCAFKVHTSGLIEDQCDDALELDFANKYLGGGALSRGCVQEEIRFMINPELIAGMFFLTCMDDNEAIQIVGPERFSCYTGYASSFRFAGEYIDKKPVDHFGRKRTRIVAIDALYGPKLRHFKHQCLLRESNKAFCGFLHQCKYPQNWSFKENGYQEMQLDRNGSNPDCLCMEISSSCETPSDYDEMNIGKLANSVGRNSIQVERQECMDHEDRIGIATGNWGCGAFGGDPELKAMIQWLAASQARRPFISYYTFGEEALRKLDKEIKKARMENRTDLKSILPYLPLVDQSSSLVWPPSIAQELEAMSRGPSHSKINSGEALASCITNMWKSLSLDSSSFARFALQGYALFFDEEVPRNESARWFDKVLPALASLLLHLPSILEMHYSKADQVLDGGITTGLRILDSQEAGIVFLSQELIAALLACSFFCLFPEADRASRHLQGINFDELFSFLYMRHWKEQKHRIRCITHYFERISLCMPTGFVSFERKVLPLAFNPLHVSYPEADFWHKSVVPLCRIEVHTSGFIEDQPGEALEVDFADENFGGLSLSNGCLQEEVRFMINPELIAGMLFLPRMDDNEAIEIVGVERFSHYVGYDSSFQFAGDYADKRELDILRRRKTRVIAIDAIPQPGLRQYKREGLLREVNKAFCGYLQESKYLVNKSCNMPFAEDIKSCFSVQSETLSSVSDPFQSASESQDQESSREKQRLNCNKIGVATGNWGCGVFGGDPELKTMIQWLAASQSGRSFMSYYTFGLKTLQNLDQVTKWIECQEWTVGDLWSKLEEYSSERLSGRTQTGLFSWLIPSLSA